MEHLSVTALLIILVVLILISAFFSGSETAMMALNRYRLRHLARSQNKAAIRVSHLLERPDRLLGVILIGNTFANIMASAVATLIAVRIWGDGGIMIATILLTLVVLIFAEVTPKTLAATHAQVLSLRASLPLSILLNILYPVVWFANVIGNGLLWLFRVPIRKRAIEHLTTEEFSTMVAEAGDNIPDDHQSMMLAILGLEKITVNDIMVPRNEINGINLEEKWSVILKRLVHTQHTRLPVYSGDIDHIQGFLHVRNAMKLLARNQLDRSNLINCLQEVHYVPENTGLSQLLLNFRGAKRRVAMVVDEYGDILGLVALEDILEEIVGEFTTDTAATFKGIRPQTDGSYLVDGGANVREVNRLMNWTLDTSGPKTMSGLITEYLEMLPSEGVCLRISGYPIEIISVVDNLVKQARIYPNLKLQSSLMEEFKP